MSNGPRTPRRLKPLFYAALLLTILLIGYRIYLFIFEPPHFGVHADQIEQIQDHTANQSRLDFAVVGNIQNSIGLFEQEMIPLLNRADLDFLVSAGNAVNGGGEDKYRALYRTMSNLDMPYLLTVGKAESSAFGELNFYDHFGPNFYSMRVGDTLFAFLDSTDPDTFKFQLHWIEEQLRDSRLSRRFVFIGHPMFEIGYESAFELNNSYLEDTAFRDRLHELFIQYRVDAVFSSNLPVYERRRRDGVEYIITGGAGGLVLNTGNSFYHYVAVSSSEDNVEIEVNEVAIGQHRIMMFLESVWFVIHSFFYVGHINFLLIICVFIVISIKLYTYVFVERDYYPNYSLDVRPYEDRRLRVSMVTNNYLPFIGGVPISIARLRQGLEQLEHRVQIIAPAYPGVKQSREGIVRIPSFASIGENGQFRLANIFSRGITRALKEFQPDLVHLHHPVWLGWIGLIRARMLRLPTVFTYHTRLEHYAHFVPLPGPLFRNLISHAAIRGFANRCTGVIVPTDSASEYLRMIGVTSPVYVHPTGIDITSIRKTDPDRSSQLRRSHGIGGDQRVLVSVSRLSKEKNIYFLIDAMEKLRGLMGDSFHLLIIGTGDEQDRLQQRINDLDLADRITLVGAVPPDEVWDYYQLSDVFVFASKSETQGMVILEAMAAGLPVVAVRSSGIEDAVKDQVTGFKTQERLEHWVHAVHRLLTDAGLYQVMSTQAVAFAEQHSIERFAQNVADTYREILALHNQHPGL